MMTDVDLFYRGRSIEVKGTQVHDNFSSENPQH